MESQKFTQQEAKEISQKIGIDWSKCDFTLEQFRIGLEVESEHGPHGPGGKKTDVTGDDPLAYGKIAWAHLLEMSDYYTKLLEMEKSSSATSWFKRAYDYLEIGHGDDPYNDWDNEKINWAKERVLLWQFGYNGEIHFAEFNKQHRDHSELPEIDGCFVTGRIDLNKNIGSIAIPSPHLVKIDINQQRYLLNKLYDILEQKFPQVKFYVFDQKRRGVPLQEYKGRM